MNARRSKTKLQTEPTCPLCGDEEITTSQESFTFNYGPKELTAKVPVRRCKACEFEYLDGEAERLEHEAVCRHLGVLSPTEIRRIRGKCNMTRARFAEVTGLGEASLNRWENGLSIQTHAYDRYLRLLTRPRNILALEEFVSSDAPLRTSHPAEHRLRVLGVDDGKQDSFQLRIRKQLRINSRKPKTKLREAQPKCTCPLCGGGEITTAWKPFAFNYGSGESMAELTVNVPARRCKAKGCEFEYLDYEAERLKHEAVCRHLGSLSPAEIRRIREGFGMTRAEFAQVTGFGEASLNRWENGLSIQTHAYDRYLRLLTRPRNLRDLERLVNSVTLPQTATPAGSPFRIVEVTDNLRKQQESFQLRKVA